MGALTYIKETRAEMRHVNWPSRKQVAVFTAIVVVSCFMTAAFLGFFDLVFSWGLKAIVGPSSAPPAEIIPSAVDEGRLEIGGTGESGASDTLDFSAGPVAP